MLTVITLLKLKPSPNGEKHGERTFWREHGARYLARWLDGVRMHVPETKRIVVMTDSLVDGIRLRDGEWFVGLADDVDAPGFWAKLNMFRRDVSWGKCLYMDLDNVINGPLDELCALEPDPLIMLDDRRVPGLPNGSMILFDADQCRFIWERYAAWPRGFEAHHVVDGNGDDYDAYQNAYDQAFIADSLFRKYRGLRFFQDLLPEGYILNSRSELPNAPDWTTARVIVGGGMGKEGKPHLSTHPGFSLR